MCDKISKNQYSIELQDDQSFFFNVKDDGEGNVLLQNGCPTKHARIMFPQMKKKLILLNFIKDF